MLEWQPQKEIDPLKLNELRDTNAGIYPFYGQATANNGIISFEQLTDRVLNNKDGKPTILIHSNNQGIVYLESPFYLKDGHGATSVLQSPNLNKVNQMFIVAAIDKVIKQKYSYDHKATKIELKHTIIYLPQKNGKIDYVFMEDFVSDLEKRYITELQAYSDAELDAYLKVAGISDYTLTESEQDALKKLSSNSIDWGEFTYQDIFNNIEQGRRLKKADQISGKIPFVMSGITNNGVVNYIDNPVASFPKNSITVDIFGNAFYRSYQFGAGDDTGVYWNNQIDYSCATLLFFTAAIEKSIRGKYSYGNKLRSSQSIQFKMKLPKKGKSPDYEYMELLISAVQKLVIKDVVEYNDKKIKTTKSVVSSHSNQ